MTKPKILLDPILPTQEEIVVFKLLLKVLEASQQDSRNLAVLEVGNETISKEQN